MTSQFSIPKTDSIPLVILYRSLYIVKQKFQKYKSQITEIYNKYSLESIKNEIVNPSQSQILQIKINISSFKGTHFIFDTILFPCNSVNSFSLNATEVY